MSVEIGNAASLGGAIVMVGAVIATCARAWRTLRRRARLLSIARDVTATHARLLSVRRKQLVVHDGYGNYRLKPWIDHVDYFIGSVILREARQQGLRIDGIIKGTIAWSRLTETLLSTLHGLDDQSDIRDGDILSGEHYEILCRNLLQARGWTVETTPATGDQGADLIAEAGGIRLIVQCKFHSRPVGNKAVQEAYAAVSFHAGDCAAVVSNAIFTRSAQQLAQSSGVLLLHHDQLADLGRIIRGDVSGRSASAVVRP